jgi:GT2 family glycosyltransferase
MTAAAASEKLAKMLGVPSMVVEAGHSIEVDWVTGASVLLRSQALREVGLFDDGFFLYFDEVELMHRLRKRGWTSRHVPASRVFHLEGAATGLGAADARPFPKYWYESRRRYFALTGGRPAVLGANLGWLLGRVLSLPKRLLGRSTRSRAILSNLLSPPWATRRDVSSSAPAWGEAPGRPPKWILDRD